MTIYRNGGAEPDPDPALVELLHGHQWNDVAASCACGWTQREHLGWAAQTNHPLHVAAAITSEIARVSLQFAEQLIDEPMGQELKRLRAIEQRAHSVATPEPPPAWPNDHSDDDRSLALWILAANE